MASPSEKEKEPKKEKTSKEAKPAGRPNPVLFSIGLNLGRTTRFLSKHSRSLLTGAARSAGTSIGGRESKKRKRFGGWRSRPRKIRREMEDVFLEIGQEIYQAATEEKSKLKVSDEVRVLIDRVSKLQEELDNLEAEKQKAREARQAPEEEGAIEDILPDVEAGAELGDQGEETEPEAAGQEEEGEYESVLGGEPDLPVKATEAEAEEKETKKDDKAK